MSQTGQMQSLGRYELLHLLGQGGMGEVYLAKISGAAGFEKPCIVKTILPSLVSDRQFLDRFQHEAKVLVHLIHSNIAQVYDMGEHGGTYFMALEYVPGVDLSHLMQRAREQNRPIPVPIALYLGSKMAEGLGYAHRKTGPDGQPLGIVHRDVSPHNAMVSYEGEVKIIDFGLAKSTARSKYTLPATVMGKLGYMSPEQARAETVDHRTDIYACGIVVWEMLANEPYLEPGTMGEMMAAMANPKPRSLVGLRPEIDEALDRVVQRALRPRKEERYAKADDFARELAASLLRLGASIGAEEVGAYVRAMCPDAYEKQQRLISSISTLKQKSVLRPGPQAADEMAYGATAVRATPVPPPLQPNPHAAPQPGSGPQQSVHHPPPGSVPQASPYPPGSGAQPGYYPPPVSGPQPGYYPPPISGPMQAPKGKGGLVAGLLIGAVVLVGLTAGAMWYFLGRKGPEPAPTPVATAPAQQEPVKSPEPQKPPEPAAQKGEVGAEPADAAKPAEPEKTAEAPTPAEDPKKRGKRRRDGPREMIAVSKVAAIFKDRGEMYAAVPLEAGSEVVIVGRAVNGKRPKLGTAVVIESKGKLSRLRLDEDSSDEPGKKWVVVPDGAPPSVGADAVAKADPAADKAAGDKTDPAKADAPKTDAARTDPQATADPPKPEEPQKPKVLKGWAGFDAPFGAIVSDLVGTVKVRNNDTFTWTDCWVQYRGRSYRMGSLAPNSMRQLDFAKFGSGYRRPVPANKIGITCAEGQADYMP